MKEALTAEKRVNMAAPDDLAIRACRLLVEDGPECECGRLEVCFRCAAQAALQPDPARPSKEPRETKARLTDAQCDEVIDQLQEIEWSGITRDDVRTWDGIIAEARCSSPVEPRETTMPHLLDKFTEALKAALRSADRNACACGHAVEEHGHDPKYPGSTACTVEGCGCIAYEGDANG